MMRFSKMLLAVGAAAMLAVACSNADDADGPTAKATSAPGGDYLEMVRFDGEIGAVVIGNPDAEVELVEYASLTCGHCKTFHEEVLPSIKENYIATGKVRLVFQEFPTPPVELALAGFAVARCAGPENYVAVLDDFFAQQNDIFEAARNGTVGPKLIEFAEGHGISEDEFEPCIINQENRRAVSNSVSHGQAQGVNSTPTIILNGERLDTPASRTPDGLADIIDAALAGDTETANEN